MKKRRFLFSACFLLLAFRLFPMDWPSASALMTKNFGLNDGGLPHMGVTFEGEGPLAAADGAELLFSRRAEDRASRLPSPLGSWIALDHGDGIVSIYGRFDDTADESNTAVLKTGALQGDAVSGTGGSGRIEKGLNLGEAGISGWSSQRGFYFQLFDRKERRWINPVMIIPPPETSVPVIMSVRLRDSRGRLFNPYQIGTLAQDRYVILVEALARNTRGNPLAPYRIICSLNGTETGVLNFETYSARDGSLVVYRNGLVPVTQVYAPAPAYEIAEVWFSRGQTTLEIITQDIAGNSRNSVYRFQVD